jgi:transcription termination/antitermination protein NusG
MRTDELNETDPTHAPDEGAPDEPSAEPVTPDASTESPTQPDADVVEPEAIVSQPEAAEPADPAEPDEVEAEAADESLRVVSEESLEAVESSQTVPDVAEAAAGTETVEPETEATEREEAVELEADEPAPVPAAAPVDDDPFRGYGDWYVVHTYSGYENKVKTNLESRIHTMQMEGKIFGVHIPMEDVMEIKSGKKQVVKKKQFPGYLLVRMIYDNDSWYVVRNTPGVTGFVSAGTGSKPTPLSKHEVEKILAVKKEEVRPQVRLGFEEGDVVRITSGPFADFNGTINEINPDQAKLKVLVNIFDRETPVELSFDQVSKV